MLLCIEMAIFAVMHIFAFPWKAYSIKHSYSNPLNEPGSGFSGGGEPRYLGFFHAIFDAFNPWDIVKMTARGFRWLFVGVRKRHDDSSYQDDDLSKTSTAYGRVGPTYVATGEPATELVNNKDDSRGRSNTFEDDRAGLLASQARMGRVPSASPYRAYNSGPYDAVGTGPESQIDLGQPPSMPPRPAGLGIAGEGFDAKPSEFDYDDDTEYHPHQGPMAGAPRTDAGGAVHPAHRREQSDWPLSENAQSTRPPPPYGPPEGGMF